MKKQDVNIKIYSDLEDISSINSALRQLNLESIPIAFTNHTQFVAEPDTVIILQIENIDSKLIAEVLNKKRDLNNKIIVVIRNNNALLVSSLVKFGFDDLYIFPYEIVKFISRLKEIIENGQYYTSENYLTGLDFQLNSIESIVGRSPNFAKVLGLAKKVSEKSTSNILLLGETGSGKGLFAKAIHNHSKNKNDPFVDIICTAIPETLLESELFGYEAGAFTSARNRKLGLFELAGEGTLFLDEIGDMSLNLQAKLLRAIEKKIIKRVGGVIDIPINARIISATNKNLEDMVENSSFRRDLYHRLNVVTIELPPLRERCDDIVLLANFFIDQFNREFGKAVKKINKEVTHFFKAYSWPGNIRELKNAIERAVLLSEDGSLSLADFSNLINTVPINSLDRNIPDPPQMIRMDLNYAAIDLKKLERYYAKRVLEKVGGNKSQAAKLLGISRPKLDTLLKI
ncbi:MAG: sigma 54-interacting transcriptional regulator [Ignavibacteriaceae bacterium]|nr:sigma 54-interacting transcriptional regulator [Ignavibacteriaceae bacterium]